jgi:hypothetical protein
MARAQRKKNKAFRNNKVGSDFFGMLHQVIKHFVLAGSACERPFLPEPTTESMKS